MSRVERSIFTDFLTFLLLAVLCVSAKAEDSNWQVIGTYTSNFMTTDSQGNLYLSDFSSNQIRIRDKQGQWSVIANSGTGSGQVFGPAGVAVSESGILYVADSANGGRIQVRDTSGAWSTLEGFHAANIRYPKGLAVDSKGNLFIADFGEHILYQRSAEGAWTVLQQYNADPFVTNGPFFLATDASDNLYLIDTQDPGNVQQRDADGHWKTLLHQTNKLTGLTVDRAGNAYVSDSTVGGRILKLDKTNGFWSTLADFGHDLGQVANPTGIAVDEKGNLYVSDTGNGRLLRYTPKPTLDFVDPNPELVDKDSDRLLYDPNKALVLPKRRGTTADGLSKLLLIYQTAFKPDYPLEFKVDNQGDPRYHGVDSDGSFIPYGNDTTPSDMAVIDPSMMTNVDGKWTAIVEYTPPVYYYNLYPEDISRSRDLKITVYNQNEPSSPLAQKVLELDRPPVVLVHGLWGDTSSWTDGTLSMEQTKRTFSFKRSLDTNGFDSYLADYKDYNGNDFDPTINPNGGIVSVQNMIHFVLNKYHDHDIAITQVDVVAHSLGGLITRGVIQQPNYYLNSNYNKGYIHRLITIQTPHNGSEVARLIWNHKDDHVYIYNPIPTGTPLDNIPIVTDKKSILNLIFGNVEDGAVQALIPGSSAFCSLGQTPVKAFAIVTTWSPDATESYKILNKVGRFISGDAKFDLDKTVHKDQSDLIVSVTSQRGKLIYPYITNPPIPSVIHSDIAVEGVSLSKDVSSKQSIEVLNKIIQLLNSDDASFDKDGFQPPDCPTPPIPPQSSVPLQQPSDETPPGYISISEPADGSTFDYNPRTRIKVSAKIEGFNPQLLLFASDKLGVVDASVFPFTGEFEITPTTYLGKANISVIAMDEFGNVRASTINIFLKPTIAPTELNVEPSRLHLTDDVTETQLHILGTFPFGDDTTISDVSSSTLGTKYLPSHGNEFLTVSDDGKVSALKSGEEIIAVHFGNLTVNIPVSITVTLPVSYSGDLSGDGQINIEDAVMSLQIIVGLFIPTESQLRAGDINRDNEVTIQDTVMILQKIVGINN